MPIWMVLILWLVYLALTANLEASNLVLGLLIASGLTLLVQPRRRRIDLRRIPRAMLALVQYIVIVVYDVIKSGLAMARVILDPALPIKPGIIAIPSGCSSELATALSAHSISLAPGEMVVEISDDGVMYTHTLDITHAADYVADAQRLRRELLRDIFI
jgi:multicomponent Na+:H+ antiporter subunit E